MIVVDVKTTVLNVLADGIAKWQIADGMADGV